MDTKAVFDTLFNDPNTYRDGNGAARQAAFRTAIAGYSEIDLDELESTAVGEFDNLHGRNDADSKATLLPQLRKLADGVNAIRSLKKERAAAAAPAQPTAPAAAPAAPAGGTGPATPAGTAPTTSAPQEAPQMTAPSAPGAEVVAASGTTTILQPGETAAPWQSMPFDIEAAGSTYVITASAGAPGVEAGEQFKDFGKLAGLLSAKFEALGRGMNDPSQMMLASARPEDWSNTYSNISRSMIASLAFSRKHDFVMKHQHDWQVIEEACRESRLPGGSLTPQPTSLTAAPGTPGWCAPCEVRYDFCPPAVLDGIVDLPTVIAARGCLTFPTMPDFGQLYAGTGFCYPASDYDLETPPGGGDPNVVPWAKNKPCMMVPCPDTQTCTLDPCGVCLQSSILVERAYPELIQYFIANALVAWGHRMNCRDISQMIAKSTRVPVTGSVGDPATDRQSIGAPTGPGATASILEVIDFYATWLRYKYRLGVNASIEVVLPEWGKGVIRADLSKRMGVDLLSVTDAMIDAYLLIRKVRVQWVLGLDEAFCDTGTTSPPVQIDPATSQKFGGNYVLGQAASAGPPAVPQVPPALWPRTISFLMYPAGTFFRARMNLVNIEGGLVDSALLKRNERLLLFVEEASVVCKRCYESLYLTVDICASGQTGGASTNRPLCITTGG